jgi:hypothetical protein
MRWSDLPLKPTPRMLRQFAAAWVVAFLLLALHQGSARGHPTAGYALGAIGLAGLPGLLLPRLMKWPFIVATLVTFPIGWVVSQIVLALMFYAVLTPVALWFRWRGRDELHLRPKPGNGSQWVGKPETTDPGRYLKQY